MFYQPNRINQAGEISTRFGGIVPDDLLTAFTDALAHSNKPAVEVGGDPHPWDRIFVCGLDPCDGLEMILLPLAYMIDLGRHHTSLTCARTFAELKALCNDTYDCAMSDLTEGAEFPTLEDYIASDECEARPPTLRENIHDDAERIAHQQEYERLHAAFLAEAEREYQGLDPYGFRPPTDEDECDFGRYEEWRLSFGGNTDAVYPKTAMHGVVPDAVEEEFATLEACYWDGPHAIYQASDKQDIIAAMEELGFICVEDEYLIEACYGLENDMANFEKHVAWFANLERVLEGPDE